MGPGRKRIVVLGNYRQTITVVRSLARAGYDVVLGRCGVSSSAEASRFTSAVWVHPDPRSTAEFRSALFALLEGHADVAYLFPVGEIEVDALLPIRRVVEPRVVVAAGEEATRLCFDKPRTYELASELGIPVPRTFVACAADQLWRATHEIGFPLVLKRPSSFSLLQGEKALICRSAEELAGLTRALVENGEPIVVQKWYAGHRHNCQFAACNGTMVAYFQQEVLRTDRADGTGYGVEGVSSAPRSDLRSFCERLVERLRYTGAGCAQFLVDDGSPDLVLLECNPRLDATCDLPYRCGVDFPLLAVHCVDPSASAAHRLPSIPVPYPIGRRFYSVFADLEGVRDALRKGALARRGLLRAALRVVASTARLDRLQLGWSWRDPLPSVVLLWQAVRSVANTNRDLIRGLGTLRRRPRRPARHRTS